MRIKKVPYIYALLLWLIAAIFVSCTPTSTEVTTIVAGCSEGGSGIFTPEDVRCHLDQTDPSQVQRIDEEIMVILAEPQTIADWVGAAIIYNRPVFNMRVRNCHLRGSKNAFFS
jgi:hypothetical protein